LISFALTAGNRGYATVSDAAFLTSLVAFDLKSASLLGTVYASDGYELAGLLVTPWDHLIVCDRDYENPGLRIFDAGTGTVAPDVPQPLSTGLPPFEIILLEP
jgi:hypothetical protein